MVVTSFVGKDVDAEAQHASDNLIALTSGEDHSYRDEDPIPYMAFGGGRVRYFVSVNPGGIEEKREIIELSAEAYRDVIATLNLPVRNKLIDLLGSFDVERLGEWIHRVIGRE
jgi:hypothetical protein